MRRDLVSAPEIYYHGGRPGLKVGDILLPPTETGITPWLDQRAMSHKSAAAYAAWLQIPKRRQEREHVFVTREQWVATLFAQMAYTAGTLYRVEPLGDIGEGYTVRMLGRTYSETTCDRARIVAIVKEGITQRDTVSVLGEIEPVAS